VNITIDANSGFCFGVDHAVDVAEHELDERGFVYCLGDIVHNEAESGRLKQKGLVVIDHQKLKDLHHARVIIRAHGEPPETYRIAYQNHLELIDATCPVVLQLQRAVRRASLEMEIVDGQIVIYGKREHPEVVGLTGQSNDKAIVVGGEYDLDQIDYNSSVILFSQTTKDVVGLQKIAEAIQSRLSTAENKGNAKFQLRDSICRQVSNRLPEIKKFAGSVDVMVFVSGKKSSNGMALFNACLEVNPLTKLVASPDELVSEWFQGAINVGVSGATSTPLWLLEEVGHRIEQIAG